MNKIFLITLYLSIVALGVITLSDIYYSVKQRNLIRAYEQYYSNTETLLDDLDSAYNWVDGYDSYEYYSSKAKIDSLKNHFN